MAGLLKAVLMAALLASACAQNCVGPNITTSGYANAKSCFIGYQGPAAAVQAAMASKNLQNITATGLDSRCTGPYGRCVCVRYTMDCYFLSFGTRISGVSAGNCPPGQLFTFYDFNYGADSCFNNNDSYVSAQASLGLPPNFFACGSDNCNTVVPLPTNWPAPILPTTPTTSAEAKASTSEAAQQRVQFSLVAVVLLSNAAAALMP